MKRKPEYPIEELFLKRWSPRAMSGESMTDDEFMPLFEAARWAPSCFNEQPWRFLYAKRGSEHWDAFLELLMEGNREWAKNAALLVCVVSKDYFDRNQKPNGTHAFDAGSAWENLALQATTMGWVAHAMAGFDHEKAVKVLKIPKGHHPQAMIVIGKPGRKEDLPEPLRAREAPSERKPLSEIIQSGPWS